MSDKRAAILKQYASRLPDEPGVYIFVGDDEKVLYIGKAKSLKKRVASYFGQSGSARIELLVRKASKIEHIVTPTESEALLLENNLIKKEQPRYNVLLKDDKSFPWIVIKDEAFPRVMMTRKVTEGDGEYFGPYTSAAMTRSLLSMIQQIYKPRTCALKLDERKISLGKYRACIAFQIGRCKAPCEGRVSANEYAESVRQIRRILCGNLRELTKELEGIIKEYAADLRYEEAQEVKDILDAVSRFRSKSVVVNPSAGDLDVTGFSAGGDMAVVSFMRVVEGSVVQAFSLSLKRQFEESGPELLSLAIGEIINRVGSLSSTVIVPFEPEMTYGDSRYVVPVRGDRKKLLDMAERNALFSRLQMAKKESPGPPGNLNTTTLEGLRVDLNMVQTPAHIEGFDISTSQGANTVAACVVFRNGMPVRSEFRHYIIKGVEGQNDFAAMREVIFRRYSRVIREGLQMPDLIIVDGGKGQLTSALDGLSTINTTIEPVVIGVAKRLEIIYRKNDPVPLYLDKRGRSLKLIQKVRNEAHRFVLALHRKRMLGQLTSTDLGNIKGVGHKTISNLRDHFGTLEGIGERSLEELSAVVGEGRARLIKNFFNRENRDAD